MAYVFKFTGPGNYMLIEMTMPEWYAENGKHIRGMFDRDEDDEPKYPIYTLVTPETARKYVKEGGIHNTGLYINEDGKVRYAKPDPDGIQ